MTTTPAQLIRLRGEARRLGFADVGQLLRAAGIVDRKGRDQDPRWISASEASAVITQCANGTVFHPAPVPEPAAALDLSSIPTEALRAELQRRGA